MTDPLGVVGTVTGVAGLILAAVGTRSGVRGQRAGARALRIAEEERDDRVAREAVRARQDAEEPIRRLGVSVTDERANTAATVHAGGEQPISWTLQLENPTSTVLTVEYVTTDHVSRGGGTTPWGSISVNRTLGPYSTIRLPRQHGRWVLVDGTASGHYELHELAVRDALGRLWVRRPDHSVELLEGTA